MRWRDTSNPRTRNDSRLHQDPGRAAVQRGGVLMLLEVIKEQRPDGRWMLEIRHPLLIDPSGGPGYWVMHRSWYTHWQALSDSLLSVRADVYRIKGRLYPPLPIEPGDTEPETREEFRSVSDDVSFQHFKEGWHCKECGKNQSFEVQSTYRADIDNRGFQRDVGPLCHGCAHPKEPT